MKTVIIKSLLSVIAVLLLTPLCGQSLRPLSKDKRDSLLISISKKVLEKKAPEYLLEYGKPMISKQVIHFKSKKEELEEPKDSPFYGTKNGQVYYIVEFPQDESIESFEEGFVAQVYIWEDNSKPWLLYLGNGMIENLQ
ncbi:hypothetical protein [Bacteroides helcogenes]|uniref:Uncharacterized protein n=1 Tax=Bacteroides helcogenes (strain ATCC 35417 / DSM 20613 / JCM 6297 / CCUG 15421 / P 36-108) TaxID=693979 RepID=E6SN92_BACT6|nr:hypothetical protein [Bacteroides helcogenes]ADV44745.1 hypothetical protein Bache_2803 [Bacteroides helcogenes P 36-108]MDY5238493.1 hypothetical protein [Bacteroides helcogenes]